MVDDQSKVDGIIKVTEIISDYAHFKSIVDLGFNVHHAEFDFDKIMMFSWIKEAIENGRKH